MKTMESELQRLDNELYVMYSRSLEIAELKWLPNIKPKDGAYHSYPHIKGVIRQIDRLLYDDDDNQISFNASELYVLLCAILMHDIGKKSKEGKRMEESYEFINNNWAELGLPTKKVALIIAEICQFQARPELRNMIEFSAKYYIDQFNRSEPIRGKLLGALLLLGNSMDNTCSRTEPHFSGEQQLSEVIGSFRSKIADVRFDRQYKMVRVILDKKCFYERDIMGVDALKGGLYDYLYNHIKDKNGPSSSETTLYTIANDMIVMEEKTALVKDELNIMGIPVEKWLIECDEQLFHIYKGKDKNKETLSSAYALEPIINLDYCLEVLKGICTLSGGIFAQNFFSYSELVNFIREEEQKTYKVKCAVRRLALLLKEKQKEEKNVNYVIYYDENNWSFYCYANCRPVNGEDQKDAVYNETRKIIEERLKKQYAE